MFGARKHTRHCSHAPHRLLILIAKGACASDEIPAQYLPNGAAKSGGFYRSFWQNF